jgi:hypothetical protein
LTPTASAAAFGHRKMQAFFCDSHFARFCGLFVLKNLCKKFLDRKWDGFHQVDFTLFCIFRCVDEL